MRFEKKVCNLGEIGQIVNVLIDENMPTMANATMITHWYLNT